ncbi:MAG TPA: branched-chain amino acid transaminase [Acidobacteriota bacterium]
MDSHEGGQPVPGTFAYFEGKLVPLEEAKISVLTHGFLYGTGIFEGIRGYYNEDQKDLYIFRLKDHYHRFKSNCRFLMIDLHQSVEELCDITLEIIRKSGFKEDIYIRPVAYKSAQRIGLRLDGTSELTIFAVPMGAYLNRERPLHVTISSWRRVEDNAIPSRAKITGGYVNLSVASAEAINAGFDEAILLNENGSVSEAAGMNLFVVRNGTLITPAVTDNVLEGITRNTIFEMARDLEIPYEQRSIDRSELTVAEEAFLCGTGAEIAVIGSIDSRNIGTGQKGPITARIQDLYFQTVRGRVSRYKKWLTPVWNA